MEKVDQEDHTDFIFWGNGESKLKNNQKKHKVLFGFSDKKTVQKLYFYGDATFYLSQGELYKEGRLRFEPEKREKKKDSKELVILRNSSMAMNLPVTDLSFGFNHIMLLTTQGIVFTWGDNYYGQLG